MSSTNDFEIENGILKKYTGPGGELVVPDGVKSITPISAWLGHSTIGTTANIYTHLDENNKLSSANAILSILHKK